MNVIPSRGKIVKKKIVVCRMNLGVDQSVQPILISLSSYTLVFCTSLVSLRFQFYAQNELYKTIMIAEVDKIILALTKENKKKSFFNALRERG